MFRYTGLLGLLLIIAPYLLGFANNAAAFWTSLVLGAILVITSFLEGLAADRETWEYWVIGIVGVGTILTPFILGFSAASTSLWALVIIGLVTMLIAGIKLFGKRLTLKRPHYR